MSLRVLVAMSGGVDSSVAAALLVDEGYEVVGATMKLWGGPSDSGCCSVADVDDARRVADRLGIDHRVFNFDEEFSSGVIDRYLAEHATGRTPNPCVDCNNTVKFGAFARRATRLGFEAIATGHHARVQVFAGVPHLLRGVDQKKDQSYVLSMLSGSQLRRVLLPIGGLTKTRVREIAEEKELRTFSKPESQDVCFIPSRTDPDARRRFIGSRIRTHAGRVVEASSNQVVGEVGALELLTVGQRRGLGISGGVSRYVVRVDVEAETVFIGGRNDLLVEEVVLAPRTWVRHPLAPGSAVLAQTSAHGRVHTARVTEAGVAFDAPVRRPAPGQVVACYVGDEVVGAGVAA